MDMVGNGGQTALITACRNVHVACARALIDANAAVDMADDSGETALMAMLNGCAAGSGVVNIDNGFGAAMLAAKIVLAGERAAERAARREATAVLRALESVEGGDGDGGEENYKLF